MQKATSSIQSETSELSIPLHFTTSLLKSPIEVFVSILILPATEPEIASVTKCIITSTIGAAIPNTHIHHGIWRS